MTRKQRESRIEQLNEEIEERIDAEDYQGALPLVTELAAHTRELNGDTSLEYAAALEEQAEVYVALGNLDAAKGIYNWVLQLRVEKLGRRHPVIAETERALR